MRSKLGKRVSYVFTTFNRIKRLVSSTDTNDWIKTSWFYSSNSVLNTEKYFQVLFILILKNSVR